MRPIITQRHYDVAKSILNNKIGLTGQIVRVEVLEDSIRIETQEVVK